MDSSFRQRARPRRPVGPEQAAYLPGYELALGGQREPFESFLGLLASSSFHEELPWKPSRRSLLAIAVLFVVRTP